MQKTNNDDQATKQQLEDLRNTMIQERQLMLHNLQIKHYEEVMKLKDQYVLLERKYQMVQAAHKKLQNQYQSKVTKIVTDYEDREAVLKQKTSYQVNLEKQSAKRDRDTMERKHRMEIKSLKNQMQAMKQQFAKRISEEKTSNTNKIISHYEEMLNDLRLNNEITTKQKAIQSQKKSKNHAKKLAQAQKKRTDMKVAFDRQKADMLFKIESLEQSKTQLKIHIENLHKQLANAQKDKSALKNDLDFQTLVMKNQVQQVKDDYQVKQNELRSLLNEKIDIKNLQMTKFSERVKAEVQNLLQKNNDRVVLIQKEYSQLKKVMGQKTSLPQDIQALKVFYNGYIKIEEQLQKQKQAKKNLQMELLSKCSIEKVFTSKTFTNPQQESKLKEIQQQKQKANNGKLNALGRDGWVKAVAAANKNKEERLQQFSNTTVKF